MAYDKDRHEFDPKTGYMIEKHTKERVGEKPWPLPKHENHGAEYPKWIGKHLVNDAVEEEKLTQKDNRKENHRNKGMHK